MLEKRKWGWKERSSREGGIKRELRRVNLREVEKMVVLRREEQILPWLEGQAEIKGKLAGRVGEGRGARRDGVQLE